MLLFILVCSVWYYCSYATFHLISICTISFFPEIFPCHKTLGMPETISFFSIGENSLFIIIMATFGLVSNFLLLIILFYLIFFNFPVFFRIKIFIFLLLLFCFFHFFSSIGLECILFIYCLLLKFSMLTELYIIFYEF